VAWTGKGERTLLAQDGATVAADDYEAEALLGGIMDDGDFGLGMWIASLWTVLACLEFEDGPLVLKVTTN